jgi:hypothetical protein
MRIQLQIIATGIAATLLGYSAVPAVAACAPESEAALPPITQSAGSIVSEQLGTNVRNGTVISMNSTHMAIACRHKGKTAQLDLVLNGVTVQRGAIAVGSQVTVHYRTQDNRNFATSIQLRKSWNEIESWPSQH